MYTFIGGYRTSRKHTLWVAPVGWGGGAVVQQHCTIHVKFFYRWRRATLDSMHKGTPGARDDMLSPIAIWLSIRYSNYLCLMPHQIIKPMTLVYKLVLRLIKEQKTQNLGGNRTHCLHNSSMTALQLSYQALGIHVVGS